MTFVDTAAVVHTALPRHNLPTALTPFVGRADERAALLERLRDPACRMVTIAGLGGAGKTRLALEVARSLIPDTEGSLFPDGIYFVPLATLTPDDVLKDTLAIVVAEALGLVLSGPDAATIQVRNYLRGKAMLLVFDNFEHLLGEARCLSDLLQAAPGVKILVTSRERLNLHGEWIVELDGLPFPDDQCSNVETLKRLNVQTFNSDKLEQYDAIRLFVQTARAQVADFQLTDAAAPAVARICRLVAGLPLGIELAAGAMHVRSCDEIAGAIAQSLDFLTTEAGDRPTRQQSLRAVFASSWQLLSAHERRGLRRLTVFQGSFTREAAAAVVELRI